MVRLKHFGTGTGSVPWQSALDLDLTRWHWLKLLWEYADFPAATAQCLRPLSAFGTVGPGPFDAAAETRHA